jgi:ABC-type transport system substrate-binding protein
LKHGFFTLIVTALGATLASPALHAAPEPESAALQPKIYVGVYLSDISDFDLTKGRFNADLQLWVKWLGSETVPDVALANGDVEQRTEVARESDGDWRSVRWRVQGAFRGTFPLHRFPLDHQQLKIQLELPAGRGELVPDLAGSGMAPAFSITGWLYEPYFRAEKSRSAYYSDFGSVSREGQPRQVKAVTFTVELKRPILAYLIKFMLPLAIIITMALLACFIRGDQIEVRAGIGITALLSCVAFQFSQAENLPNVPYLMMVDKVFFAAYVIISATLIESVVVFNLYDEHPRLTTRIDRSSYVLVPLVVAISGTLFIRSFTRVEAPDRTAAAADAKQPAANSARDELVVTTASLRSLHIMGISRGLLRRGLTYEVEGKRVAHLAEAVPELTNEHVRFLPDGGMVVLWRLRPGLRWSNGSPITSADLAFSALLPENPARKRITVLDDRTVEIEFGERVSNNLEAFALYPKKPTQAIYKDKGRKGLTEWLRTNAPPGDGPYLLETFEANKVLLLRRNPHFAGPRPPIQRIRLTVDPRTVAEKMKAGDAHLASLVGPTSYAALAAWPGATARSAPVERIYFLQPDLNTPPYNNLQVRKALLHAVNRAVAGEHLFGEDTVVAHSYRPAWVEDHEPGVETYPYDPDRARQLIKAAGLKLPLPIRILARKQPKGAPERMFLERAIEDLKAAGFAVELEWFSGSPFKKWLAGDHGALLFYLKTGSDASLFWNVPYDQKKGHFITDQPSRLFSEKLVGMYRRYKSSLFEERRISLSRQMQLEWSKSLPLIPLLNGISRSVHAADLVGWAPARGKDYWWNVETWHFKRPAKPAPEKP